MTNSHPDLVVSQSKVQLGVNPRFCESIQQLINTWDWVGIDLHLFVT